MVVSVYIRYLQMSIEWLNTQLPGGGSFGLSGTVATHGTFAK